MNATFLRATSLSMLAGIAPCCAQTVRTLPPAFESTVGDARSNLLFTFADLSYQFAVPGSDLSGLQGPRLTGFTTRMEEDEPFVWPDGDINFDTYDIYIGELVPPEPPEYMLRSRFADNVVPGTEIQVRGGPMTIAAGSFVSFGTLPNPWGTHLVAFDVPYPIDPSKDYIVTIRHPGHTGSRQQFDAFHSVGGTPYLSMSRGSYTATTGGNPLTPYTIVQFVVDSSVCYANCDGSTVQPVLNVDDFSCFINAFAASSVLPSAQQILHYANCDGSTAAPALNIDDFTCFINSYASGCP